jgi:hypothetical protein
MKTYTFKVVITEGSDEFWESLEGKTGTDVILEAITDTLCDAGWVDAEVKLIEYKDE